MAASVLYMEEAVNSISMITPQTSDKGAKEEEDKVEKWFRWFWDDAPKSLSEIRFGVGWFGSGKSLMEIFEVRIISNHKKKHKLNINGTVTVDASHGITDIFRRAWQNPEVIHSQGIITLMGPDISAPAYDYNDIHLDIKDDRREICKGTLTWSYQCTNTYNKLLTRQVSGKNGMGLVTYSVFTCAILISVQIKLPKMEVFDFESTKKIDPVKIYGQIDFSITGVPTFDYVTTTLFRRKHTNSASVSAEGRLLPLSKSLIAFPLGGNIEISMHLKEHLMCKSGNCNVVIDLVRCTPKHFGNHKCKIHSKYGPIKVKLTAYPPFMHPKSLAAFKEEMRKII